MTNLRQECEITEMVRSLNSLSKNNLDTFNIIVQDIINSNCKDENNIELTLDRLLDFCFDNEVLVLYKKLCRYYYDINHEAVKEYVGYYFEMYEDDK
jgi:hypothetical protein